MTAPPRVAVALEGYGWHPEAWRHTTDTRPVTAGDYWADLARTAERGLVDFVTFDDSLSPQRRRRPEIDPRWLAGRPDAVLLAARVAAVTRHVGLVPVANVTHTPAGQLAKTFVTLNDISCGRVGWQIRVGAAAHEAQLYGRPPPAGEVFDDALRAVAAVRDLWPSPQPVVAALAHNPRVYEFAAAGADLVFITPQGDDSVTTILGEVEQAGGRGLQVYADLYVTFDGVVDERSDALVFSGTPRELADHIVAWHRLGVHGIRLRPAVNSADLPVIAGELIPLLQHRVGFRTGYSDGETLRQRLGLPADRSVKASQP